MADDPDVQVVLAAATPEDLFGEAVADLGQLKRAYAHLARAHRPDRSPVAFAHIQAMFRRARADLEREPAVAPAEAPAPSPTVDPRPPASPAPRPDPLPAVLAQAAQLGATDPTAYLHEVRRAMWTQSWTAPPEPLLQVLELLAGARIDGPPGLVDRAMRDAALMLGFWHAVRDQSVPRGLLTVVSKAWGSRADVAARALLEHPFDSHGGAQEGFIPYLREHHPALLTMFADIERVIEGTSDRQKLPEDATRPSQGAPRDLRLWARLRPVWIAEGRVPLDSWTARTAMFLLVAIPVAPYVSKLNRAILVGAMVAHGVPWLIGRVFDAAMARGVIPSGWAAVAEVMDVGRERGLTSLETLHLCVPFLRAASDAEDRQACEPTDVLMRLDGHPFAVWMMMTQTVVARLEEQLGRAPS